MVAQGKPVGLHKVSEQVPTKPVITETLTMPTDPDTLYHDLKRFSGKGIPRGQPVATLEERFWSKVSKTGPCGCWLWLGSRDGNGYGDVWDGEQRRLVKAHRVAFALSSNLPIEGLELDHLCRNPPCVNPAHLEPVTHKVNMERGARAQKTECVNGHPYTPENEARQNGHRYCKACNRDRQSNRRLIARTQT